MVAKTEDTFSRDMAKLWSIFILNVIFLLMGPRLDKKIHIIHVRHEQR